ncbi:hypothetical protein HFM1/MER3 [Blumeria hordei DH14]|uniref:DNA 3'-5' helicase n=1 Tax=Blumeria graminis f. sp. hordei (strain DH14) TaxID=546991 RepID=N1J720_BLUG1|nr:hypothetical protein HFM1/MER3 [Blumeria hordei DH14]
MVSFRRENARLAAHNRFLNTETGLQNEIYHLNYSPTKITSVKSNPNPKTLSLQHAPSIAQGIQLVSPQNLPDKLRRVFPFELFNAIQSKCFGPIFDTNDNIIVSAPTGSGKTVLLELAICKLVEKYPSGQFKVIYQAPTKSLCSERLRDWQKKFNHLNLPCAELTSDTNQSDMARVRNASIIVTTPEKWDSITRKWSDHHKLVQMVKLFLIDEVHFLKDIRGATLEAVVSRMKIMGANVRFVALSATVPNSEDIAVWLGRDHTNQHLPAHRETFGEEFRPVKLQKHVHAFDGTFNDYAFDKFLDGKLTSLLQKYTQKKPIMVFCFTRKSCEGTASILSEWWTRQHTSDRPWLAPRQKVCVGCKELQSLVSCGVAFHHAGLDAQDRHAIETGYLKGDISVICCTSTLAVGVNLPCHMVILKGTVGFQDGFLREYSDLEVMQMLGRAGRPQFDDSAIAIIITRTGKSERYKKMIAGQDILESTLHLNLIEHLNSEISLGSVKDLSQAKIWITRTFLSVRMRQNPMFYQISGVTDRCDTDERLEKVCERDINLLKEYLLVRGEERLACTEYGEAMCRYMVQFETMKLLVSIPKQANKEQILSTLCRAVEFKDLRIKPAERSCLRQLNKSPLIKFPVSEPISTIAQKVSLIIQVHLGGIPYPDEKEFGPIRRQFSTDKNIIFERAQRLIRCVIDCKAFDLDSVSARHALELARSLCAEYWENSNLQLRQVPQIGPVAHRKLTEANINTVYELAQQDSASIERIVSKNPPFGMKMKDTLASFPRLKIFVEIVNKNYHMEVKKTLIYVRASISYENKEPPIWLNRKPNVAFMAETSDGKGFDIRFTVDLSKWREIKCWVACEEIVGTLRSKVISYDMLGPNFLKPSGRNDSNIVTSKTLEFDQDEFGDDDLDDEDMLAFVDGVEKSDNNHYNSDEFMDIDNLELKNKSSTLLTKSSTNNRMKPIIESTRMDNGRWTCQHDCRDHGVRKDGNLCKHKCCHEGTDKPSRLKRMVSHVNSLSKTAIAYTEGKSLDVKKRTKKSPKPNTRFLETKPEPCQNGIANVNSVEIIDLSIESPKPSIKSIPPLIYEIYNENENDLAVIETPKKQNATFSPICTVESVMTPKALDFNEEYQLGNIEAGILSSPTFKAIDLEGGSHCGTVISGEDSLFCTSSASNLNTNFGYKPEAITSESGLHQDFITNTPKSENFREKNRIQENTISMSNSIITSSPVQTEKFNKRRPSSLSPTIPAKKHCQLFNTDLLETQRDGTGSRPVPTWVKEFDSDLIDELKDYVEFID